MGQGGGLGGGHKEDSDTQCRGPGPGVGSPICKALFSSVSYLRRPRAAGRAGKASLPAAAAAPRVMTRDRGYSGRGPRTGPPRPRLAGPVVPLASQSPICQCESESHTDGPGRL